MSFLSHKALLEEKYNAFNCPEFIKNDPISLPHRFKNIQNIELIGFWTAILSWGQRKTIINKATELIELMGGNPIDFVLHHKGKDVRRFEHFKHRTFLYPDTQYFLSFFKRYYNEHASLEDAFFNSDMEDDENVANGLIQFRNLFFESGTHLKRTEKHVASPKRNSSCKRINMFLRWMVRKDDRGVDFGIWNKIRMDQLCMPLDVHVEKIGRRLGLIQRKQRDWKTVIELTNNLKSLDPKDPVKYDYALFGMGILEKQSQLPG